MALLPTMKIKHPEVDGNYIIINKEDFDPNTMERFGRARRPKSNDLVFPTAEEVAETIRSLDIEDKSNWTGNGLAQITALERAMPGKKITASLRDEATALLESE